MQAEVLDAGLDDELLAVVTASGALVAAAQWTGPVHDELNRPHLERADDLVWELPDEVVEWVQARARELFDE